MGLQPEHRTSLGAYAVVSAQAHEPPYDDEPDRFIVRAGATPRAVYPAAAISTEGSHIVLCVVHAAEGAARGRTADGPDLPMIPAASFPFDERMQYWSGGDEVFAGGGPLEYPGRGDVAGVTHLVLRWTLQLGFEDGDPFPMSYEFRLTLTDAAGAGYRVTLPFIVEEATP